MGLFSVIRRVASGRGGREIPRVAFPPLIACCFPASVVALQRAEQLLSQNRGGCLLDHLFRADFLQNAQVMTSQSPRFDIALLLGPNLVLGCTDEYTMLVGDPNKFFA